MKTPKINFEPLASADGSPAECQSRSQPNTKMIIILNRKDRENICQDSCLPEAAAVITVDHNGIIECTKNRHGKIGVVCDQTNPEDLLGWVRELAREGRIEK